MSDSDSIPEGKQGLAARVMRILVYALEMPVAPVVHGFSDQTWANPAPGQPLQWVSDGRLCHGREHFDPGAHERALTSQVGLTRQEAALAVRLVRGGSLEEAAAELCISSEMAKIHLKRIFMKADLHCFPECAARPKPTTAHSS